ncbi:MAG: DUF1800 domain-containing protein [Planctomycetota bacterium]|jgi:hypothetical protein
MVQAVRRHSLLLLLLLVAAPGASVAAPAPDSLAPLAEDGWTIEAAAHLLRRAGFGGSTTDVRSLHRRGLEGAVDHLVDYGQTPLAALPPLEITVRNRPPRSAYEGKSEEERRAISNAYNRANNLQNEAVKEWWLRRMVSTTRPLEERLTLFWHGHFTSGYRQVRNSYHMYVQNTTLRGHAAGNFRTLLHEMSRDPAMLRYLDGDRNRKGRPNENFAREVMELFTLGVGNYTEDDIKEAARAFTGWMHVNNRFVFNPRQHDDGEKEFLGRRGRFDGHDVLEIILEQDAAARYLADELFRYFVHEDPAPAVVDGLAETLRNADYDLAPMLTQLFRSEAFYAPEARAVRVKSPVGYVVSLFRTLEIEPPPTLRLSRMTAVLGQDLLDPPNVKGWDGGLDWITTSHLLNRYNIAVAVVGTVQDRGLLAGMRAEQRVRPNRRRARPPQPSGGDMDGPETGADEMGAGGMEGPPAGGAREGEQLRPPSRRPRARPGPGPVPLFDVQADVVRHGLSGAGEIVDHYGTLLLAGGLDADTRAALVAYLDADAAFDPATNAGRERLHGLLRLLVSTPDFQLN